VARYALIAFASVIALIIGVPFTGIVTPAFCQEPAAGEDGAQRGAAQYELLAREGFRLTKEQTASLEQALAKTPEDFDARARLMGFYFAAGLKSLGAEPTIEARRRHILWLIANHSDSPLLGTPEATLDARGHSLADPEGYQQAKKAWLEQTAKRDASAAVLGNAGHYFRLPDKALAMEFYARARKLEPGWVMMEGEVMAFAVVGIMDMNDNGFPGPADLSEASSDFAKSVRQQLESTQDAALLIVAAHHLSARGFMAQKMAEARTREKPPVDALDLAESLYKRAQVLVPCKPDCNYGLAEIYERRAMTATSADDKAALARARYEQLVVATAELPEDDPAYTRQLLDLARAGFDAGDLDRAEVLAKKLVALAPKMKQELAGTPSETDQQMKPDQRLRRMNMRWAVEQIWHHGHLLLGRVALRRGDIEAAKTDLLEAGRLEDGRNFSSSGPNMALAKELLEKGEKDTVLQYFELCRKFWTYRGASALDSWTAAVRKGEMPNFGANLFF